MGSRREWVACVETREWKHQVRVPGFVTIEHVHVEAVGGLDAQGERVSQPELHIGAERFRVGPATLHTRTDSVGGARTGGGERLDGFVLRRAVAIAKLK